MTTLAATPAAREDSYDRRNRNRRYRSIHSKLRELGIDDETTQRNVFYLVGSSRSLKASSQKDLANIEAFLANRIQDAKRAAPVTTAPSDDEIQATWLD